MTDALRDDGKSTVSGYVREMAALGIIIDPEKASALRELIYYVGAEASRKARSQAIDDCKAVLADRIAAEEAYCRPLKGNARGTSNAILAALSGLNGEPIYVPLGWRGFTVKYEVTVPIRKAAEQKI